MPAPTRHFSLLAPLLALAVAACTDPGSAEPDTRAAEDTANAVELPAPVRPISTGPTSTCTIIEGAVFCWGGYDWERDPVFPDPSLPPLGGYFGDFDDAVAVSVIDDARCVVDGTGALWCDAEDGSLTPIDGVTDAVDVVTGYFGQTCVLFSDGEVTCDGTPVAVPEASAIAGAFDHSCVITTDGEIWCWGIMALGDGNMVAEDVDTPVAVASDREFVQVAAAFSSTCAVDTAGDVHCWGRINSQSVPTRIDGLSGVVAVAVGGPSPSAACAIREGGAVWCWEAGSEPTPIGVDDARWIDGDGQFCAIRSTDEVVCWGENRSGEAGAPLRARNGSTVRVELPPIEAIAARDQSACALSVDGEVWCWGAQTPRANPARIEGLPPMDQIGVGEAFACARARDDGHLWCWGDVRGAIVPFEQPQRMTIIGPVDRFAISTSDLCTHRGSTVTCSNSGCPNRETAVGGDIEQLVLGRNRACTRSTGGEVTCWRLADPECAMPEPEPSLAGARMIAMIGGAVCAIIDGGVRCNAESSFGTATSEEIVSIGGNIELGLYIDQALCAVTRAGAVACFGDFDWPNDALVDVTEVALGSDFGCALQSGGTVLCWGSNHQNQLGDLSLVWVDEPWTVDLPE